MSSAIIRDTYELANNYIISKDHGVEPDKLFNALSSLVGEKIDIPTQLCLIDGLSGMDYQSVQNELATINEKESVRKDKGVYYTPKDVVDFILINCTKALYKQIDHLKMQDNNLEDIPVEEFCKEKRILEPTCGAGEFLLAALTMKLEMWKNNGFPFSIGDIKQIISTLSGNDINHESVIITKVRLFLAVLNICGGETAVAVVSELNNAFTSVDFVELPEDYKQSFDMVIGNPPYVEDSKYGEVKNKYGNIYCNVLNNSANLLNDDGVIGFIIPISYSTTPRMEKIRSDLLDKVQSQYILTYADRPDCLFSSVHQKLCILIACSSETQEVYTSHYNYWYKEERKELFANVSTTKNNFCSTQFIPKLGSELEASIYSKITKHRTSIFDNLQKKGNPVYLNMRACFWIKAFLSPKKSSEYKTLYFNSLPVAYYYYCILNSSLFWWYWICVSDCWHITQKELEGFKVPSIESYDMVERLALALEQKLEETKKYIGSKQTDYEYKHKDCLKEIFDIDDYVCKLYGLSSEETDFIKHFGIQYRTSAGGNNVKRNR